MSTNKTFPVLLPDLQISLYSSLQSLRTLYFREGLKATVEAGDFDLRILDAIDPLNIDIVHDLQVLTLGPQLRGSRNVDGGQAAVETMVDLLKVSIHFGGDPDISVMARLESGSRKLVAMELKGRTDVSNIWNRLGEAEKSHQTARRNGYNELWTITSVDLQSNPETLITPNTNLHRQHSSSFCPES